MAEELPPQPPTADESQLVDGLLELLRPPQLDSKPPDRAAAERPGDDAPYPPGESLSDGAASSSAQARLLSARQLMRLVSDQLRLGSSGTEVLQMQTRIIDQLDELIGALEGSAEEAPSPTAQLPSQSLVRKEQLAEQSSDLPPPGQSSESTEQQADGGRESDASQTSAAAASPGQRGQVAGSGPRLTDPIDLQQSVWGHLPNRLRSQMQSRMVEQFLPGYREQLEDYYRALLGQENDQ